MHPKLAGIWNDRAADGVTQPHTHTHTHKHKKVAYQTNSERREIAKSVYSQLKGWIAIRRNRKKKKALANSENVKKKLGIKRMNGKAME